MTAQVRRPLDRYIEVGRFVAEEFDRTDEVIKKEAKVEVIPWPLSNLSMLFYAGLAHNFLENGFRYDAPSVFYARKLSSVFSVYIPRISFQVEGREGKGKTMAVPELSWSAVLGYIEGIPVIGSALAAIHLLGHAILMTKAAHRFQQTLAMIRTQSKEQDPDLEKCRITTDRLFQEARDLNIHHDHFFGSCLSLIPFLKPAVRLVQAGLYYYWEKHPGDPLPQTS